MALTNNQYEAVHRDGNIIVSAGAGSGKTFTMISRIADKLIKGDARLDQMLIVTFTRAAAADMRFKLSKRLFELKREGVYGKAIDDAVDAMSVCNIGTLHSYCQKLIKMYFYAAKVDPSATLCEDGEVKLMKRAAAEAAVSSAVDMGDAEFIAMFDMLSTRKSTDGAITAVLDIMEYALSTPDPYGYLRSVKPDAEFFGLIDESFEPRREVLTYKVKALIPDLAAAGMAKHVGAANELCDFIYGKISDITATKHSKTGGYEDILNEKFLKIKQDCKDLVKARSEAENAKLRSGEKFARALCAVAENALERYAASKARQGKTDYSDLEHGALNVLRDAACMSEITRGIKYVFIDEFQDVNPLQSEIAETFRAAGAEMFVVGDVKQSIYGFRRCSPAHFINAIKNAVHIDDIRSGAVSADKTAGRYVHIPLTDNFRSDKTVIDFINNVFDGKMTEEFGGADYKNKDRLVCGKPSAADKVTGAEFVLIETPLAEDTDSGIYSVRDSAGAASAPDPEAVFVADTVSKWLNESMDLYESRKAVFDEELKRYKTLKSDFDAGVIDAEPMPPDPPELPTLGEAAVLMRSFDAKFCAALGEEFDKRGIPYDFGRKSSVKTYPAAVALVDILRYIDNRYDDVALYTALRSPMGGFSDEQLAEIACEGGAAFAARGQGDARAFWQKADAYDGRYNEKLAKFFVLRDDIAKHAKKLDCGDTLGYITASIDYFQHVYESGGDARAVEALIEYAAERRTDIHGFLDYYDSADFNLAVENGGDVVTITTEHSSKGLEYDLVIVADTGKQFNMKDVSQRVLITENGVAVKLPDKQGEKPVLTVPWIVENGFAPYKLRQEELRLFYVALTRAKNKLVVCGKVKNRVEFDEASVPPCGAHMPCEFMYGMNVSSPKPYNPIIGASPACLTSAAASIEENLESPQIVPQIVDAVRERCEAVPEHVDIPIKTCVTALAHSVALDEQLDYTSGAVVLTDDEIAHDHEQKRLDGKLGKRRGSSSKEDDVDARVRGTAYHRAMELIDFAAPDLDAVKSACENYDLVDGDTVLRAAEIMRELTKDATHVFKERYFIVDMPSRYIGSAAAGQNTLVQGIIDLMAVNSNGEVTLVDYKTGDPNTLVNDAYVTQLRLYAHAVEIATGGKYRVKNTYLYSFEASKLIGINIA